MHFPVTLDLYDVLGVVEARKAGIWSEGSELRCLPGLCPALPASTLAATKLQSKIFPFKNTPAGWEQRAHPIFPLWRKGHESRESCAHHGTCPETPVGWRDGAKSWGFFFERQSWKADKHRRGAVAVILAHKCTGFSCQIQLLPECIQATESWIQPAQGTAMRVGAWKNGPVHQHMQHLPHVTPLAHVYAHQITHWFTQCLQGLVRWGSFTAKNVLCASMSLRGTILPCNNHSLSLPAAASHA